MEKVISVSLLMECSLYFQRSVEKFDTLEYLSTSMGIPKSRLEPALLQLVSLGILWEVRVTGKDTLYGYRNPSIYVIH